jgi:hypothetical protein
MRRALVIGVDGYVSLPALEGCTVDAHSVAEVLRRNADGTPNFDVRAIIAAEGESATVAAIREAIEELFRDPADVALLYFAGHASHGATGGYLCGSESRGHGDGVSLADVLVWANKSPAGNKVIVLDCCHAGAAGSDPLSPGTSQLAEGITILAAATATQYALGTRAGGVFTSLFVDALRGGACNLVGEITPGAVYAHIDQALGAWEQRPVFKTNVRKFVWLRRVPAPIPYASLQRLPQLFPTADHHFELDPTFEPEGPNPVAEHTAIFAILQQYRSVNLVVPVGALHMYHAAMEGKGCGLTPLGKHYRALIAAGRL